ncbi:uncharacterized protein C8orf48 homolog [Sciurus carolinensis]|uniref:uncharacterized protein C8orf48 homolog n=1 Tax=Sciurus carolinensis TaxID=30640 RepID=UPI001FB4DBF6|nr:uncharacterized protein C8orf48 homolog [Sciurus carolinensis]
MAHLSDETVRSFTDEVPSSGSLSSSGEQQSWPTSSGTESDSGKLAASLEVLTKQSELSDLKNNEKKLTEKWISYLKDKEANYERNQPEAKLQTEVTRLSDEELNALQSFCTTKINLLHHRVDSKKKSNRHKKLQFRLDPEASKVNALKCTVPDELLNRIYFENVRTTLKQVAATKQHISSRCPNCISKKAELAQSVFLKQKKTLLESLLLHEKIDEHLHTTDLLTHVVEAHQGLPRLSDDPTLIWKRLKEKTQIGYSGFEKSDIKRKM